MIKKINLIICFVLLTTFFILETNAQQIDNKDKKRTIYWFEVSVKMTPNKETKFLEYSLHRMGKKVFSGDVYDFKEKLWGGMASGSKLLVGPFSTYPDANEAMLMYDVKDTNEVENTSEKYWFLVKLNFSERSGSYELERMAASVASGSKSEFKDILVESLTFKTIAIGPFGDKLDAEESKRLYRQEE